MIDLKIWPDRRPNRKNTYLYSITWGNEVLVSDKAAPVCHACRELLEIGIGGKARILDANTGKHRMTIDIDEMAYKDLYENDKSGLGYVAHREFDRSVFA